MEPVIVGAVVTVAVSVVNAVVRVVHRRLDVSVERARITETARTERMRVLTGRTATSAPHRPRRPEVQTARRSGGDHDGGRPQR